MSDFVQPLEISIPNLMIGGGGSTSWGGITGNINNQTDLKNALNAKANNSDLAVVAKSGNYNDLSNKPTIPTVTANPTVIGTEASLTSLGINGTNYRVPSGGGGEDYFNSNVMLIDHQYLVDGIPNTLSAYKASYARGYKWLEIDINPTSDGEWIIAHNTSNTVYKNGVQESVVWANKTAYEISQYTWDSAGQHPVATLNEVFSAFKNTDCRFILDRKGSITSNESLIQVASKYGMLDSILLSYYSTSQLSNDVTLLAKYPYIPIRVYLNNSYSSASTYNSMVALMSQIKNPMYADINTSNNNYYKAHIATAIALGLPIIFSACLENNKAVWQILARGVMTDSSQDHWYPSISEFANCFAPDETHLANIVCGTQSINIENGTTTDNIVASTSATTKNGFLYAYSKNPSIAYVQQNTWGLNITFTVHGASNGSTTIEVFNALGNKVSIPVTVASAVVKTLDSITASVSNHTVVKGETYTPNATVIAHYTDASTADVTASATHNSIDTSSLGEKTMTFTYTEDGVTKTSDVTITVIESGGKTYLENNYVDGRRIGGGVIGNHSGDALSYVNVESGNTYETDYSTKTQFYFGISVAKDTVVEEITFPYVASSNGMLIRTDSTGAHLDLKVYEVQSGTKTLASISATKTKTTYEVGETFSNADVVVTAHYSDSTTAIVTSSATIGTVDTSTSGSKTLNISYTEDGVTKTTTIAITVGEQPTSELFDIHPRIALNVTSQYPRGRFMAINTRGFVAPKGVEVIANTDLQVNHLFEIPSTATGITFTCPNYYGAIGLWTEVDGVLTRGFDSGWSESKGVQSATFTAGQYEYVACPFGNGTDNVETVIDPTGWSVVFTYD